MPFAKGRKKTGGRQKGTVNSVKKPARMIDEFEKDHPGINPLSELTRIALDDETEITLKVACWKEVARYRIPAIKPVSAPISLDVGLTP